MTTERRRLDSTCIDKVSISDIIARKRDGHVLSDEEIEFFVQGTVDRSIQESQIGAMLMAMYIRDLDNEETASLTKAMTLSGDVMQWPKEWKGMVVDKHSTGGVGDKVSLILAPALAACGVKVPMISGRGLGHTGGTLDKLESIPGFNVSMTDQEMLKVLTDVGCCIVGQTSNIVPADKILYAIRDVTATTANIGLITASIISKKIAETLDSLVLDVKIGKGAVAKDEKNARELATRMVRAGNSYGVNTVAMLTKMDAPLGNMIGNALEVAESIYCLHGDGPSDLTDLVVRFGGQLLYNAGKATSLQEAGEMVQATLKNGKAIAKFCEMMKAQGVNGDVADKLCQKGRDVFEILPKSKYSKELKAATSGYVHDIDAMNIAIVSCKLGAGRRKAGATINFAVGLELQTSVGEPIKEEVYQKESPIIIDEILLISGESWITIHHDDDELADGYLDLLTEALEVKQEPLDTTKVATRVIDVVT